MKCTICGCEKFKCTTPSRLFRVCNNCEAMERHRALWTLMKDSIKDDSVILDISPISKYIFGGFLNKTKPTVKYIGIDKYRDGNPNDKRDVSFCDMYFDLIDIPKFLEENSFDIVIMQHVLEEITDYKQCLKNIYCVMKAGGIAYLEIPCNCFLSEHENQEANKFGNVWQFSKKMLYDELIEMFTSVEIVDYEEGGFSGSFFVCVK